MSSNDDRDLQTILSTKEDRFRRGDVTRPILSEMKNSLLFSVDWPELMQGTPTAISSMGALFSASSSEKARADFRPPPAGFKYLRYNSIQSNLIESANLGRFAFEEAEKGMDAIQMTSQMINSKIGDAISTLNDPVGARMLLKAQLDSVRRGAQTNFERAREIDLRFMNWLLYVCELHAACLQQDNDPRSALLTDKINLVVEQSLVDSEKSTNDDARKARELMGKQSEMASKAFNEVSQELPAGWNLFGQQLDEDLAECLTVAWNAAIPALINDLNPMAKASGSAAAMSAAFPKQTTDPAYPEVVKIGGCLALMQAIVSGRKANGGIDWEMAQGSNDGGKSSIKFLVSILSIFKDRFASVATGAEPSTTLKSIFDTTLRIARAINDTINNSRLGSSFPNKDSEQVKQWQADFSVAYGKANSLRGTANSIPGGSASSIPLMGAGSDGRTPKPNVNSAQAQAVLESVKNRLLVTQQMLTASRENYSKTTDMLLQRQNKLSEIQTNLVRLTASAPQLEEIKKIIFECIKLIINMKQQFVNLVRYFKATDTVVDICMQHYVLPFTESAKKMGEDERSGPNGSKMIGDYTLIDVQRSQVLSAMLTLRSYFTVYGDLAKLWVALSRDYLRPGIQMCHELSSITGRDTNDMKRKVDTLNRWSADSSNRINEMAKQKQQENIDSMESRLNEVSEMVKKISAPTADIVKAITAGTNVNKEAAQKSIAERSTVNPLVGLAAT